MTKPAVALMIGAPKDEPKSKEGRFKAPDGFDLEGKKPGDTIQAVVDLEVEDDGMLCVKKLNGMDVAGYDDEKKEMPEEKPYEGGFADSVMGGTEAEGDE